MGPTTPWGRAGVLAGGYAVVASAYIYASSQWAGGLGLDAQSQATIETFKGFGFVAVTALVLLGVLAAQFQRLANSARAPLTPASAGPRKRAQAPSARRGGQGARGRGT